MDRTLQRKVDIFSSKEEYIISGEFMHMNERFIHLVVPRNEVLKQGMPVRLVLASEVYGVTRYHCVVGKERNEEFLMTRPDFVGLDFSIEYKEETIQRRRDIKVKISEEVTALLYHPIISSKFIKTFKGEIMDISASGIRIATTEEMEVNQEFSFFFPPIGENEKLTARIVRIQDERDGRKGYGCILKGLKKNQEYELRQFVYKEQLQQFK
ncbi:MAG: PilZ domain-containing protein [Firmicutes bacterium]|nr:PilZ domain-containing protein [Bacillota bacterium]